MVVHTCSPSCWEVEAGRLAVQGVILSYIPSLRPASSTLDLITKQKLQNILRYLEWHFICFAKKQEQKTSLRLDFAFKCEFYEMLIKARDPDSAHENDSNVFNLTDSGQENCFPGSLAGLCLVPAPAYCQRRGLCAGY